MRADKSCGAALPVGQARSILGKFTWPGTFASTIGVIQPPYLMISEAVLNRHSTNLILDSHPRFSMTWRPVSHCIVANKYKTFPVFIII